MDREKVIKWADICLSSAYSEKCNECPYQINHEGLYSCVEGILRDTLTMLKEQDELLKHEYWRGYNNGRADERGLQEGTIMQTFSPD